jgi:hypothetical protein
MAGSRGGLAVAREEVPLIAAEVQPEPVFPDHEATVETANRLI